MFRTPRQLPPLPTMLDDLPATPAQVARHLGISHQTLRRYTTSGEAPRAIQLALFWETRWGRSTADCEAANWASLQQGRVQGLERYVSRLQARISTLEALLDAHALAANEPFFSRA